jgi:hypothetical protein
MGFGPGIFYRGANYTIHRIEVQRFEHRSEVRAFGWRVRKDGTLGTHKYEKHIYLTREEEQQVLGHHQELVARFP